MSLSKKHFEFNGRNYVADFAMDCGDFNSIDTIKVIVSPEFFHSLDFHPELIELNWFGHKKAWGDKYA